MRTAMGSWWHWGILGFVALLASTLSGVTGFGGSLILMPILVLFQGIRQAVPIITVAQLLGNLSRVYFSRHELNVPVVLWFAIGAVPAAVAGATLFSVAPARWLYPLLGSFLLLSVLLRHLPLPPWTMKRPWFFPVGLVFGFLSALLGGVGPLVAPFFLAFNLTRGAYIATEALAAAIIHLTKAVTYHHLNLLTPLTCAIGLGLGAIMILGSWLGKQLLNRLPERVFIALVEGLLILSGIQMLWMHPH